MPDYYINANEEDVLVHYVDIYYLSREDLVSRARKAVYIFNKVKRSFETTGDLNLLV